MNERSNHEFVDPSDGETPAVRQRRQEARRKAHGENARDFAIGDEHERPTRAASSETRNRIMSQIREDQERRSRLNNIPEVSITLAGRANALLNILEFEKISHQRAKLAEKGIQMARIEEAYGELLPRRDEGFDYIFPAVTDPDGSQRAELEAKLAVTGDEGRAFRNELESQLRQQAEVMEFPVSPPRNKSS